MKHKSWLLVLCFVGGTPLVSCSGGAGGESSEILIGEYGSLTGTTATFGISSKNGIDMAVDSVNRAGGPAERHPDDQPVVDEPARDRDRGLRLSRLLHRPLPGTRDGEVRHQHAESEERSRVAR